MSRTFGDFSNLLAKCGNFGIYVLQDKIKVKAEKFSAKKKNKTPLTQTENLFSVCFFSTEAVEEAV